MRQRGSKSSVAGRRLPSPFHEPRAEQRADAVIGALFGKHGIFSADPRVPGQCWSDFKDCRECDRCVVSNQCAEASARKLGLTLVTNEVRA